MNTFTTRSASFSITLSEKNSAEAALKQSMQISSKRNARVCLLRASIELLRFYRDTCRQTEARELIRPVLVGFNETLELPEIGEAQRLLVSLGGEVPDRFGREYNPVSGEHPR